jgi:hypothetical protein
LISGFRLELAVQGLKPSFEAPERPLLSLQCGGNGRFTLPEAIETLSLGLLRKPHLLALGFERLPLSRVIGALGLLGERFVPLTGLAHVYFDAANLVTQLRELPVEPFHPLVMCANPLHDHLFALRVALGAFEGFADQSHFLKQRIVAAAGWLDGLSRLRDFPARLCGGSGRLRVRAHARGKE